MNEWLRTSKLGTLAFLGLIRPQERTRVAAPPVVPQPESTFAPPRVPPTHEVPRPRVTETAVLAPNTCGAQEAFGPELSVYGASSARPAPPPPIEPRPVIDPALFDRTPPGAPGDGSLFDRPSASARSEGLPLGEPEPPPGWPASRPPAVPTAPPSTASAADVSTAPDPAVAPPVAAQAALGESLGPAPSPPPATHHGRLSFADLPASELTSSQAEPIGTRELDHAKPAVPTTPLRVGAAPAASPQTPAAPPAAAAIPTDGREQPGGDEGEVADERVPVTPGVGEPDTTVAAPVPPTCPSAVASAVDQGSSGGAQPLDLEKLLLAFGSALEASQARLGRDVLHSVLMAQQEQLMALMQTLADQRHDYREQLDRAIHGYGEQLERAVRKLSDELTPESIGQIGELFYQSAGAITGALARTERLHAKLIEKQNEILEALGTHAANLLTAITELKELGSGLAGSLATLAAQRPSPARERRFSVVTRGPDVLAALDELDSDEP